jgi:hypothetical protein
MQHRYALLTHVEVDLSEGRDREAHDRLESRWRDIESSMLLQIRQQRIDTLSARGRAAVAAAGAGGKHTRRLLAQASRHARRIIKEDMAWAVAQGRLINAAVGFALGNHDRAVAELRGAITAFESTGMALHAAAARRRLGGVVGGDEGHGLVAQADAWMSNAGVSNVEGIVRMLAPGFA